MFSTYADALRLNALYILTFYVQKLRPNFPPNDQLQSVNLRAALLRALESAKKNGALGRDTIIRKTMLDECKGERFEELLSAFSSTVLKQAAADRIATGQETISPGAALALENLDYKSDITPVKTLVLAYKVSLAKGLARRQASSARYVDFDELLAIKKRNIARRREAAQAKGQYEQGVTPGTLRTVRNNWSGNEAWMDTLLYGDGNANGSQELFSVPFNKIWRRVQQGRLADAETDAQGLLDQLDVRVKSQRKRLEELDVFRKHMGSDRRPTSPLKKKITESNTRGIDLRFEAHKALQVDNVTRNVNSNQSVEWDQGYQTIVQELYNELGEIKTANAHDILGPLLKRKKRESFLQPSHQGYEEYHEEEPISELSELEEEEPKPQTRSFEANMAPSKRLPRPFAHPQTRNLSTERRGFNADAHMSDTNSVDSATESLGELSIGSGQRKTPSPTKSSKSRHTLSLAERTRLSMVGSRFLDDEPELPSDSSASKKATSAAAPKEAEEDELVEGGYEDLLSRTRKSMAGFEKAQQKAHLERRRSIRRSKMLPRREESTFPAVAEEKEQDQDALIERLMADDNMEAIFKSRPKIRASPIPPEWDDE